MDYPADNSTQLTYTSFPYTITSNDNYSTSNYVNSNIIYNSNILNTKINTKQDTLTNATNILGVGSAITALDYNKITLNKPTNFQADWSSTIINKPSTFPADMTNIYSKTESDNKFFSFTNYNSSNNFLAKYADINSSNFDTIALRNTALTSYYTKTENDNKFFSFTNYNSSNNFLAKYTDINSSNFDTIALRNTALTSYYTKTENDNKFFSFTNYNSSNNFLAKYTDLINSNTNTSNFITSFWNTNANDANSIYLNKTYNVGRVGIGLTNPSGVFEVYEQGARIKIGSRVVGNTLTGNNIVCDYTIRAVSADSVGELFQVGSVPDYNSGVRTWYFLITKTALSMTGDGYFTGNFGIGVAPATYKCNVNGSLNSTSLYQNGTLIDFSSYATNTNITTNYYDKTTSDGRYLQLTGGTLSGNLNLTTSGGNNPLYISSTNVSANNCIQIKNNSTYTAYLGLGGTALTGNYQNNFFIESAFSSIIFNTNGRVSGSTPNMIVHSTGNVGIATNNPTNIFQIGGAGRLKICNNNTDYTLIGVDDIDNNTTNTRIVLSGSSRTSYSGFIELIAPATTGTIFFYTNGINERMRIDSSGDVSLTGILKFGSRVQDYLIDLYGGGYGFGINASTLRYNCPSGAAHKFYTGTTNNMTLDSSGNLSVNSYVYCGGTTSGIRINGNDYGNTFYQDAATIGVNAANIGFTLRNANTFNFNSLSTTPGVGYTTIASMNTGQISLNTKTIINGIGNIHNGSPYAITAGYMASGSLTIGGTNANYGTATGWSSSTAGLLMECADYTEICVHDSGTRVASLMYYDGPNNAITIGRNKGWVSTNTKIDGSLTTAQNAWIYSGEGNQRIYFAGGSTTYFQGYGAGLYDVNYEWRNHIGNVSMRLDNSFNLRVYGYLTCQFLTISNSGTDYVGVSANTALNAVGSYMFYIMYGTFTGIHRTFTNDDEYDNNNPQQFKDKYEGRIVIASGKIATDISDGKGQWDIKYDKDGITIEDALPIIQLSRKRKDKRVFGVLGSKNRDNSRAERLCINSVGEGAIWVCNSNGNIENGDYIQSSDYLGYGEKQDEFFLCNYSVAKATMDCNFELDSPYYKCEEIENNLRIAFISCTYHSG